MRKVVVSHFPSVQYKSGGVARGGLTPLHFHASGEWQPCQGSCCLTHGGLAAGRGRWAGGSSGRGAAEVFGLAVPPRLLPKSLSCDSSPDIYIGVCTIAGISTCLFNY
ncbi:unnamed protein product [Spirodela intermedia]|uniref:Uncharacterized protein n=1 Tax=Spirodela intermedia TaxID=51605 RepID=A0A7I8JDR4_SPIIN|nr:unnamed protein product [Spirodela intermedia]CAA6668267.1 unnamed protein product [Spirodela intermedia]